MDPISLALGIGSIGSSIFGAIQGNSAQNKQLDLQKQQLADQKEFSQQQIDLAKQAQTLGLATQIDGNGNAVYYDPKTNTWRTLLAPQQQRLNDASNLEQLRQQTIDAGARRSEAQTQQDVRSTERQTAGTMMGQLQENLRDPQANGKYLASQLRLNRQGQINSAFDTVGADISRQALRTGATATGGLASALARAKAQANIQLMGDPDLEGRQAALSENSAARSDLINGYNTLANRAGNIDNTPVAASPVGSQLAQVMAQARSTGQAGSASASSAVGQAAQGVRATPLPNYTTGAGQIANNIGQILGSINGQDAGGFLANLYKKNSVPNLGNTSDLLKGVNTSTF